MPACPTGHRLQGYVRFCPYCGVSVPSLVTVPEGERKPVSLQLSSAPESTADAAVAILQPSTDPGGSLHPPTHPDLGSSAETPSQSRPQLPVVEWTQPMAAVVSAGAPATVSPKGAPASQGQVTTKPNVSTSPVQRSGRPWIVAVVLLCAAGITAYVMWFSKPDDCELALQAAVELAASGDLSGARAQAVKAVATCGPSRSQQAKSLLGTLDQDVKAQALCERQLAQIEGYLADHRLQSADSSFYKLEAACAKLPKSAALQARMRAAQLLAADAATRATELLDGGDVEQSGEAILRLADIDREFPALPLLRKSLQSLEREINKPPVIIEQSRPTSLPSSSDVDKAVMVTGFLRSAEHALGELRFDAASTFVESALSVDPQNAEAHAMARRIRERELEYLKDGTILR